MGEDGGPYKKDNTAHIEEKHWTHVRKLLGYVRYASPAALVAVNALYREDLRLFQNLFLPSVKRATKVRVGSRVRRRYERPQTPLERVQACPTADAVPRGARLVALRDRLDPFVLAQRIDAQVDRIYALAQPRSLLAPAPPQPARHPSSSGAPGPSGRVTPSTAR